jgi:elongation of very long chain fatty acids protein 6
MAELLAQLRHFETTFRCDAFIKSLFFGYADTPFYAAMAYLALVFWGQQYMKDRTALNLKPLFILWNFLLAAFSIRGAMILVPPLMQTLQHDGFRHTVCHDEWWKDGQVGAWVTMFALSKIPELVDTAFLVFQKKPVIFLHWYHHTTVMLYCWLAFPNNAVGVWFAAMNFVIHSIMYSYYFMMSLSGFTRALVKPIGKIITVLQIAQMVVGMYLVFEARRFINSPTGCSGVGLPGNRAALIMYGSYFILFAKFFLESYVYKTGKKRGAKKE